MPAGTFGEWRALCFLLACFFLNGDELTILNQWGMNIFRFLLLLCLLHINPPVYKGNPFLCGFLACWGMFQESVGIFFECVLSVL